MPWCLGTAAGCQGGSFKGGTEGSLSANGAVTKGFKDTQRDSLDTIYYPLREPFLIFSNLKSRCHLWYKKWNFAFVRNPTRPKCQVLDNRTKNAGNCLKVWEKLKFLLYYNLLLSSAYSTTGDTRQKTLIYW